MQKIIVVGAGVSGAHAALTLLERNFNVELWDVGREEHSFPVATTSLHDLKKTLDDPIAYFLGKDLSALIPPATDELLRYPPSRHFLTTKNDSLWGFSSDSFFPYGSLNKGASVMNSNILSSIAQKYLFPPKKVSPNLLSERVLIQFTLSKQ